MNADEIIRALRHMDKPDMSYGYDGAYKWKSERIGHDAADLIESLQERLDEALGAEKIWSDKCIKNWSPDVKELVETTHKLRFELRESQRREKAAVEDMKALAHKYGDCEFCKWRDARGRCKEPNPGYLCAEHYKMEWRGPQEAGKGTHAE